MLSVQHSTPLPCCGPPPPPPAMVPPPPLLWSPPLPCCGPPPSPAVVPPQTGVHGESGHHRHVQQRGREGGAEHSHLHLGRSGCRREVAAPGAGRDGGQPARRRGAGQGREDCGMHACVYGHTCVRAYTRANVLYMNEVVCGELRVHFGKWCKLFSFVFGRILAG